LFYFPVEKLKGQPCITRSVRSRTCLEFSEFVVLHEERKHVVLIIQRLRKRLRRAWLTSSRAQGKFEKN